MNTVILYPILDPYRATYERTTKQHIEMVRGRKMKWEGRKGGAERREVQVKESVHTELNSYFPLNCILRNIPEHFYTRFPIYRFRFTHCIGASVVVCAWEVEAIQHPTAISLFSICSKSIGNVILCFFPIFLFRFAVSTHCSVFATGATTKTKWYYNHSNLEETAYADTCRAHRIAGKQCIWIHLTCYWWICVAPAPAGHMQNSDRYFQYL